MFLVRSYLPGQYHLYHTGIYLILYIVKLNLAENSKKSFDLKTKTNRNFIAWSAFINISMTPSLVLIFHYIQILNIAKLR